MGALTRIGDTAALADLRGRIEQRAVEAAHGPEPAWKVAEREAAATLAAEIAAAAEGRRHERIPRRFWAATVDDLDGEARALADDWTLHGMVRNVVLVGPVATGKTHLAAALARAAWDAGRDVRFVAAAELLRRLRPGGDGLGWSPHTCDVLVLDDLGVEKGSDWVAETIDDLIDSRWRAALPTIVTSNLSPDGLRNAIGERAASRLWDGALRLRLTGPSRRDTA